MLERQLLIRAAAQLDEIKRRAFEELAEFFGFVGLQPLFLELDAVELDAEDEGGLRAGAHGLGNVGDEARAVLETAAVGVCAVVGGLGDELGEEIAVGCVERLVWCAM